MKSLWIIILIWIGNCAAWAQTNPFLKDFHEFRSGVKSDYKKFLEEANKNYVDLLRGEWKEQSGNQPLKKPKDQDPKPIIADKSISNPIDSRPIKLEEVVTLPTIKKQPVPVVPIEEETIEQESVISFHYYGTTMQVRCNRSQNVEITHCSKEGIANAWEKLTKKNYSNTLYDCLQLREKHQMNDWAYLLMLDSLSVACLGSANNEATLFLSYLYQQSGYKMRMGVEDNRLYMLFATDQMLYGKIFFTIGGISYYLYSQNREVRNLQICDAAFPKEQVLSLWMNRPVKLEYSPTPVRKLVAEKYTEMDVSVSVNKNILDFYSAYPSSKANGNEMTRWAILAMTPFEPQVMQQLKASFPNIIKEMSKKEAVEKLLNWTQTAFAYEYDENVWGHDRAFFPEETLFYPFCDCEDRSIMLSRIIADLLGMECLLIFYPGHIAMAVHFEEDVQGDYIEYQGKRFVVCDPTYIGAPIGLTMPNMDNKTAKVIIIR